MRYLLATTLSGIILMASSVYAQQLKLMENKMVLPFPQLEGKVSVEQAISQRRSKRSFTSQGLTFAQIGQLLWSAQGITDETRGFRAAPSAGALYPMKIYLLKKDGLFRYIPQEHALEQVLAKDLRSELADAALGQSFIAQAAVDIVIAAVYERLNWRYGLSRGSRYSDIEAGHIAQNVHLQAVALGLGSVPVGAFDDGAVKRLLRLPGQEEPLYIIPVGYTK